MVGKGGKASLHEPSRPFTPGDMPRHLFHGNDYSNRPGSSYKMNNVLGQAADEFANFSAVKTQANSNSNNNPSDTFSTSQQSEDVMSIIERHQAKITPKIGGNFGKPQMKQYQAFVPASLNPDELIKPSSKKEGKRLTYQESDESPAQIDSGTKKKSGLEE